MAPFDPAIDKKITRTGVQFLLADIGTALTFLQLARTTRNAATRSRNIANAKEACQTVRKLMSKLKLSAKQESQVREGLEELQAQIKAMR